MICLHGVANWRMKIYSTDSYNSLSIILPSLQERRAVAHMQNSCFAEWLWKRACVCEHRQSSPPEGPALWVCGGSHHHQDRARVEHLQVRTNQDTLNDVILHHLILKHQYTPSDSIYNVSSKKFSCPLFPSQWAYPSDCDWYQPGHHSDPTHQSQIQQLWDTQCKLTQTMQVIQKLFHPG